MFPIRGLCMWHVLDSHKAVLEISANHPRTGLPSAGTLLCGSTGLADSSHFDRKLPKPATSATWPRVMCACGYSERERSSSGKSSACYEIRDSPRAEYLFPFFLLLIVEYFCIFLGRIGVINVEEYAWNIQSVHPGAPVPPASSRHSSGQVKYEITKNRC